MTPQLREACRRALHVLTADGALLRAGEAARFVLERTTPGWRRFARATRRAPLSWAVEAGYQLVARNRSLLAKLLPK